MSTHFPSFPSLYDPPVETVRLLREIDPAADLLCFGWGKWYLVRHRPNREHITSAIRALAGRADQHNRHAPGVVDLLEMWRTGTRFRANPGAFRHLYQRYLYWTAVRLGARPVAEYDRRYIRSAGFEGIVEDFRQMEWKRRHLTDTEAIAAFTAEKDAEREASRAELRDEKSALIMANHLARNPHSVTAAAPDVGRSGFTRTPSPSLVRSG